MLVGLFVALHIILNINSPFSAIRNLQLHQQILIILCSLDNRLNNETIYPIYLKTSSKYATHYLVILSDSTIWLGTGVMLVTIRLSEGGNIGDRLAEMSPALAPGPVETWP